MNYALRCPSCKFSIIEIDHYGERLVGCIECNRWSWPGSNRLIMELPEEDLEANSMLRSNAGPAWL